MSIARPSLLQLVKQVITKLIKLNNINDFGYFLSDLRLKNIFVKN